MRAAWQAVRFPVLVFLATAAWLVLVVWFSAAHLPRSPEFDEAAFEFPGSGLLSGWFRFDGGWYYGIARSGYYYAGLGQQSSVAFFPAYPLGMRAVAWVVRDEILAGIMLTWLCGLAAAVLFYRWTLARLGEQAARTALAMLVLFPYAWYLFGAVYADALFLAAVIGAFVLVERGHPVWAGLAGAVASGARPLALAVVVGLVAVVVQRRGGPRHWRSLRPADAGVLLSLAGLGGWMTYQWARFGDPLLWIKIQRAPGWDQGEGSSTWFKKQFLHRLLELPTWIADTISGSTATSAKPWYETTYTLDLLLQALLLAVFLALVVLVVRRLGWGYGLYVLTLLVIPLVGTKDFQGTGRYLLAAFPCLAVAGGLLAQHRRARLIVLPASAALLTLLASAYARGYYVA